VSISDTKLDIIENPKSEIRKWWQIRRRKYNIGLVIAGITAFILYAILGSYLIKPAGEGDEGFEITLFTTGLQGAGYLIMIAIANQFYKLGAYVDLNYNKGNNPSFRNRLYNFGFWFSFCLPFLIPLLIVIIYYKCKSPQKSYSDKLDNKV
jgi:hypothetical protein